MYTQEQDQLRMSLIQFFGSILANSNFEDASMRRQSLIALVTEELIKVCKSGNENGIDMIASKPLLRATQHIIHTREQEIRKELNDLCMNDDDIEDAVENMTYIRAGLENYIKTIK